MDEPTPPEPPVELTPSGRRRRTTRPAHTGGFQRGPWPTKPPFTISRRDTQHYFLCGYLSADGYADELAEAGGDTFPWAHYIAREYGPGTYQVQQKSGAPSFFLVSDALVARVRAAERERELDAEPDEPETEQNPPDPVELIERDLARAERLKRALGIRDEAPKPGLLDILSNPAIAPLIPQLVRALQPQQNPPGQSPWEQLGRVYESLGVTAEDMRQQLEADLAARAAATPPPEEPAP